ncbi:MAG TPA: hypothetical protein VK154_02100 [Chitinophagales bacterium]|nr:hypothetical protein [Chitinophagales bacterium]
MKKFLFPFATALLLNTQLFSQNVGIGTNAPASKTTVNGNLSIGTGYTTTAAPANGAIIEGKVGIGTASPDASTVLDIAAGNKGVSFPNVDLQSAGDVVTIPNPKKGLVVYNTGVTLSPAGLYTNTGTSGTPNWQKLSDASGTISGLSVSSPITSTGGSTPTIGLGVVPVDKGGTGLTAIGAGQVLIGNGSNTFLNTTLTPGTGVNIVSAAGSVTINNTGDLSTTNEGSLTVGAGTATTSLISSNTSGSTAVTLEAGTNVTLTETGNKITITSSNPGGTVTAVTAGAPLASSGGATPNITLTGTVPVANGGTGVTALSNVTAGSTKISLGGTPAGAVVKPFSIDVVPANIDKNTIGGSALTVPNGGTGAGTLTGYVYGNGTSTMTASTTIPGAAVTGNISSNAAGFTGNLAGDVTGTQGATVVGDDSHNHTELAAKPTYAWNAATAPNSFPKAVAASFVQGSDGWPSYGSVLHVSTYPNDGGTLQLYAPYASAYGGNSLKYRLGQYNNAGWTGWKTIWDDTNDGTGSGMDADLVDGFHASQSIVGNNIVVRDANGYTFGNYFNSTDNGINGTAQAVSGILVKSGDNYHRTADAASVRTYLGITAPTGDNLGNHTATTTLNMGSNVIRFGTNAVSYQNAGAGATYGSGDPTNGIGWGNQPLDEYGIYVAPQENISGDYTRLILGWHTGVKIGGSSSYGGTRFYNNSPVYSGSSASEIFSVGKGDNNVRVNYNIATVGDVVADQNYGLGLVGAYISTRYQNVFAMGAAYRLAADGSTPGNLYGLAWTHTNVGGQSKSPLSHQLLVMENGITKVALGTGIWTQGNLTFNDANPYINASSYYVAPGGAYFNSGTVYCEAAIQARGGIQNDAGSSSGRVRILDDLWATGWLRTDGSQGWYSETYGGGWNMVDGTWVRTYGSKPIVFGVGAYDNAASFGGYITANSVSDGHRVVGGGNSTTGYGYVGTSGNDWWYVYADNHLNSSVRSKKKDITPLDDNMMAYVMNDIDKIKPTFYRYKTETEEIVPGFETKYRPNMHLGVVLDESPDYLQDNAFSGIDIYAMGVFALTGVKYQQKQIKELKQQVNNNMVVGSSTMSATTLTVQLPVGFCKSGEVPVVNITPTSANTGFYLSASDSKSFTVTGTSPFSFNWQAVRVAGIEEENTAPVALDAKLASSLVVDQSKKDKIQEYWRKDNERTQAARRSSVEALKTENPVEYERIMEENRLADELAATEGKSAGYDVEAMRKKSELNAQKRREAMSKPAKSSMDANAPTLQKFPAVAPVPTLAPAAAETEKPKAAQQLSPEPADVDKLK